MAQILVPGIGVRDWCHGNTNSWTLTDVTSYAREQDVDLLGATGRCMFLDFRCR